MPLTNNTTAVCPHCGTSLELLPKPDTANVLIGMCPCRDWRVVVEITVSTVAEKNEATEVEAPPNGEEQ